MDISALHSIRSDYIAQAYKGSGTEKTGSFDAVFAAALDMLNETNDLQNKVEELEVQFMLGQAENTHDLSIAQQKANIALAYTVAVRDKVLEAYNSIMNMQM